MTATLHRKNQGKQFTVVLNETRQILHWHRPGEKLPLIVDQSIVGGSDYLLTPADVDYAQVHQRAPLKAIEVNVEVTEKTNVMAYTGYEDHLMEAETNGKGWYITRLTKKPTNGALWAIGGIVGVASLAVAYEVMKVFA